jgi:hypothetical protein
MQFRKELTPYPQIFLTRRGSPEHSGTHRLDIALSSVPPLLIGGPGTSKPIFFSSHQLTSQLSLLLTTGSLIHVSVFFLAEGCGAG